MKLLLKLIFFICFLLSTWSFATDFQIRSSINKDSDAAVAYNSVDDQYLVVWTESSTNSSIIMGKRVKADGTGNIGSAFSISLIGAYPSVAYNSQANEYLVTFSLFGNIIGQRVSSVGTLVGSPITYISKTNAIWSKIVYNSLGRDYLLVGAELTDLGNNRANIKVYTMKIAGNGQKVGTEYLVRDEWHEDYSFGARFSVAYAPITSAATPTGRYLLAIDTPTNLTMLDDNGVIVSKVYDSQHPGNIVDDHVPFQISKVGIPYNIDVAFGNWEGQDAFMVVWGDLEQQLNGLDRRGIWAGIVKAAPIEFESEEGVYNTAFPILNYGLEHSILKSDAKMWKPVVTYNEVAYKFMIAWREIPTTLSGNDTKVNHIRAAAVFNSYLTPDNIVLSAKSGSENPMNPIIAASTKNSNTLVVWDDERNISTKDIDLYGSLFTTTPSKALILTSPNGGEGWVEGSQQQITWESSGIGSSDVTIEYSIDNGASFNFIANQTNTDGNNTYNWTVPNTPSTQCLVQILVANLSDQSDETFTIAEPYLTIVEPNGGESWVVGSTHDIMWNNYYFSDNVKIEYSTDFGSSFSTIVSSTTNNGFYSWSIPDTTSFNCLVRISDAADSNPSDVSNDVFTILAPKLTITAPNFYEKWVGGTTHNITWTSQNILNNDVTIEYSTDNGINYQFIDFHTNVQPNESYEWTVPNVSNSFFGSRVRISLYIQGVEIADTSDMPFSIDPQIGITLISPNGGEVWQTGSQKEIKWTHTNIVDSVYILLHYMNLEYNSAGSYGITITQNDGSFIWTVNDYGLARYESKYWIEIFDITQGTEWSDTYFTIVQNTTIGDSVNVDLSSGTEITFDSVSSSGTTTLNVTQTGTPPPNSFTVFGSPNYYNIETTAEFEGNIKICIRYDDTGLDPYEESALSLFVNDTTLGQWVDITTSLDKVNNIICGEVSHLSEFAMMMPTSDPQIFIVINTNDAGEGSFRNAIDLSNANGNNDKILFNIPKSDPNYDALKGVWHIRPVTYYNSILDSNLIIDGTSQRIFIGEDTNPEGPEIVFSGSSMSSNNGCLSIQANNIEIYELTINNFPSTGMSFSRSTNCIVSGCYIGTDYLGITSASNYHGISMGPEVFNSLIGPSPFLDKPNIISGNRQTGIFIVDNSQNNTIIGNYIGINKNATDTITNKLRGIDLSSAADNNTITENIVGGNYQGIYVSESNNNLIRANRIGTNETWKYDLGNSDGILVFNNSKGNKIIENIVGFNQGWGVKIFGTGSVENKISRNSISKNLGFGIDNSDGGNTELAPPIITSVANNQISGTAGANQVIEIFADSSDEGQIYIDSTLSDASGNFTFAISELLELPNITATARDAAGNTSEFSSPFSITDVDEGNNKLPTEYVLYQNYPNPFNPSTTIEYSIPAIGNGHAHSVQLKIYNILGKEVATLVNQKQQPGNYEIIFNAIGLPSGVYFYRITSGTFTDTKKLIVMK